MKVRITSFVMLLLCCFALAQAAVTEKFWLRYKLLSPIEKGVYAHITALPHVWGIWTADYGMLPPGGARYLYRWVKPQAWSPWMKIPKAELPTADSGMFSTITFEFASSAEVKQISIGLQIAAAKDEKAVIASATMESPGNLVSFLLKRDFKAGDKLVTVFDKAAEHMATVKRLFPGPDPNVKGIVLETGLGGYKQVFGPEVLTTELKTLRALGLNSVYPNNPGIDERKFGFQFTTTFNFLPMGALFSDPNFETTVKQSTQSIRQWYEDNPFVKQGLTLVHLGDEPYFPFLIDPRTNDYGTYTSDADQAAFHKYLKERGLSPAFFGETDWAPVKPIEVWKGANQSRIDNVAKLYPGKRALYGRRLYYYSRKFQSYAFWMEYKKGTDEVIKNFPPTVKTGINVNPHLWLGPGIDDAYMQLDWGEGTRMRAITMPFTEDWLGESGSSYALSTEFLCYLADQIRADGKYRDDHIGMHVTPNSELALRQKAYALLGRGCQHINFYSYGPEYVSLDCFSQMDGMLKGMGQFTRDIEKPAALLAKMQITPAQVGVLWPFSSEIWRRSLTYNTEILTNWLALDRNQVPVDLVYEADIEEEALLPKYKVLYGVGDHITRKSAHAILAWVKKGGLLMAGPGFGLKDEFDNPLDLLKPWTGTSEAQLKVTPLLDKGWIGLAHKPEALDTVTVKDGKAVIPVFGYKQAIKQGKGTVIATFKDGSPASVEYTVGKGKIIVTGFFPGVAYAAGCNKWSNKDNPGFATIFPDNIARFILRPVRESLLQLPAVIKDMDGVQASVLTSGTQKTGDQKKALILVNFRRDYTSGSIASMKVFVPNVPHCKKVWSGSGSTVSFVKKGSGIELTLPLDVAELIIIE